MIFARNGALESHYFKNSEGQNLELFLIAPDKPRMALIFWPCTMTSSRSPFYGVPIESLFENGILTVLYNPRGHGQSEGSYSVTARAADLKEWFADQPALEGLPVYGMGHSGGATGLLVGSKDWNVMKRLFLISPILDSKASLEYMYASGKIAHFQKLFDGPGENARFARQVLANRRWLDKGYWESEELRKKLAFSLANPMGMHFENVGQFLEEIFIRAIDVRKNFKELAHKVSLFLPKSDLWYPLSTTEALAVESKIRIETLPEAREHFCLGAWGKIWSRTIETLNSDDRK